ncbi:phage integrase N-terminal SAM-like domain-containing protein [Nostoc sp.]|uniref:phage integrase N-terminal SAM-like domain-containing protein n=1 Tax=Nostoc sp. TaxID=1180 RepID=UPI003FA60948
MSMAGTMSIIKYILCCDCMLMEPRPKKLLDQLREVIRLKHYGYRTEETYVQWVKRFDYNS